MKLIFIVAMTSNRLIGREGSLPWYVPDDLRFFKRTTTGHAVIMGRKTYESMNRPLPNRRNIVITRQANYMPQVRHQDPAAGTSTSGATTGRSDPVGAPSIESSAAGAAAKPANPQSGVSGANRPPAPATLDIVASLEAAIDLCRVRNEPDAFIIGGAQIYAAAMDRVDEMIITRIEGEYEGDTFFPAWSESDWIDAGPVDAAFPAATRYVRRTARCD